MRELAHHAAIAVWMIGVLFWFLSIPPFLTVGREVVRARRAGELDIPMWYRGVPVTVIFTKNILPNVEPARQRLVGTLAGFLVCGAIFVAIVALFGPWPSS